MEKKVQKNTQLSCGKGKVQFRRKKLGDKVQAKSSNLPRRFCSNSVGTPLEFAAVSTPNIAELVLFGFFCPQPWFLRRSQHILQEKHQHFHADRQLVTKKEITIKINLQNVKERSWPSGPISNFIR